MKTNLDNAYREIFDILMGLSREIRCCSQDEAFCRDVTFHQFVILDAVAQRGELDLAELHGLLSVEKSTTTRLVNPLLAKGLLKRERATHDSRAAKLALTEEGMETHRKVWECVGAFFGSINRNIPEEQREGILASVRTFTGALKKAVAECRCCE